MSARVVLAELFLLPVLLAQGATNDEAVRDEDARRGYPRSITLTVVTDKGEPVPQALVEIWEDAEHAGLLRGLAASRWPSSAVRAKGVIPPAPVLHPPATTLRADEAGHVTIELPTPASVFEASEPTGGRSGIWTASAIPGETLSVRLNPSKTVVGVVVRSDGTPAVGARVIFGRYSFRPPSDRGEPRAPADATSGDDGGFSVDVEWGLVGHAWAQVGEERTERVSMSWAETSPVVLRVPGAFHIRGSCRGPDGEAIGRVLVTADRRSTAMQFAVTDKDGVFDIALVHAGAYSLVLSNSAGHDLILPTPITVEVSEDAPTADVLLTLARPLSILGVVTGDVGGEVTVAAHVQGAELTRFPLTAGPLRPPATFEIKGLAPGDLCDVVATLKDGQARPGGPLQASVRVRGVPAGSVGVLLDLDEAALRGGRATLRCLDAASGEPVVGAKVQPARWYAEMRRALPREDIESDVTDAEGEARLRGLPFGEDHAVTITSDGYEALTLGPLEAGAEPLELRAELSRTLSLPVRALQADGSPAAEATVQSFATPAVSISMFSAFTSVKVDAEGRASFSGGQGRALWLQAVAGAATSLPVQVTIDAGAEPIELRLVDPSNMPLGSLDVLVTVADGRPMPGMPVTLTARLPRDVQAASRAVECTTDEHGRAHVEGLWPAVWIASSRDEDRGLGSAAVVVVPGEPASVTVATR